MAIDFSRPPLDAQVARLAPHLARLLERAAERALRLHAEAVALEHLLGAAIEDGSSAAHQLVAFAFADPETVAEELLALSPGLLVVGSGATAPFSPRAVAALAAAHAASAEAGEAEVGPRAILAAALAELPPEVARGLGAERGEAAPAGAPAAGPEVFRALSAEAKRALSRANRLARGEGHGAIGPGHLAFACLQQGVEPGAAGGRSAAGLRVALAGHLEDPSAPAPRVLPIEAELVAFLERLPDGAGSLEMLAACHSGAHEELAELFGRHKVGPALIERAQGRFTDPE